jgi:hypothetical protein
VQATGKGRARLPRVAGLDAELLSRLGRKVGIDAELRAPTRRLGGLVHVRRRKCTRTHTHARVRTHTHARQNARRTARRHRNEAAGGTRLAEEVPPPAPDPVLLVDGARVVAAGGDLRGSTVFSLRRRSLTPAQGGPWSTCTGTRQAGPAWKLRAATSRKPAENVPRVPQPSGQGG